MRKAHNRTPEEIERKTIELYESFHMPKTICKMLGLSRSTFDKICKRYKIKRNIKTKEAAMLTHKRCKSCQEIKPINEFPNSSQRKHSKKFNHCYLCKKILTKKQRDDYTAQNREKIKEKNRNLARKWRRENPQYKIAQNLRRRTRELLKNKSMRSSELLGCSIDFFLSHLESKWKEGMSWANYGVYRLGQNRTWHIDHIIPCDSFDLTKVEEQKKCFHYTNLQPLWADENILKGNNF